MKNLLPIILMLLLCKSISAQETREDAESMRKKTYKEEEHGFNPEHLFVGGTLSLGYTTGYTNSSTGASVQSNTFNIGALPDIGYELTKTFDIGISTNINYYSVHYPQYNTNKLHITTYGIGTFLRITPLSPFFIQIMPEHNWIRAKYIESNYTTIAKIQSQSYLLGLGYKYMSDNNRAYFTALLMMDLGKDPYSPYKTYTQTGQLISTPVYRFAYVFFPFRRK